MAKRIKQIKMVLTPESSIVKIRGKIVHKNDSFWVVRRDRKPRPYYEIFNGEWVIYRSYKKDDAIKMSDRLDIESDLGGSNFEESTVKDRLIVIESSIPGTKKSGLSSKNWIAVAGGPKTNEVILAHELGHVMLGHGSKRDIPYMKAEKEAWHIALEAAKKTGNYDAIKIMRDKQIEIDKNREKKLGLYPRKRLTVNQVKSRAREIGAIEIEKDEERGEGWYKIIFDNKNKFDRFLKFIDKTHCNSGSYKDGDEFIVKFNIPK